MGEERFNFENLEVYQKALDYIDFVYEITRGFPKEEIFSLTDRQTFLDDRIKQRSRSLCLELSKMINGLMKSLKKV